MQLQDDVVGATREEIERLGKAVMRPQHHEVTSAANGGKHLAQEVRFVFAVAVTVAEDVAGGVRLPVAEPDLDRAVGIWSRTHA